MKIPASRQGEVHGVADFEGRQSADGEGDWLAAMLQEIVPALNIDVVPLPVPPFGEFVGKFGKDLFRIRRKAVPLVLVHENIEAVCAAHPPRCGGIF